MRLLLPVLLFTLSLVRAVPVGAQTIAVHVFTPHDASGLVDKPTTDRLSAVEDLRKRLAKNKNVHLVEDGTAATVRVEVTSVGWEDRGAKTVGTAVPVGSTAVITPPPTLNEFRGRIVVTFGTFSTDFDAGLGPLGRSVGENLGRKFDDWLKQNLSTLTALTSERVAK